MLTATQGSDSLGHQGSEHYAISCFGKFTVGEESYLEVAVWKIKSG